MAVNQANYPMAVDNDPVGGYPMPKQTSFVKGSTGNILGVNADNSLNATLVNHNYTENQLLNLAILDTTLHTGATATINTLTGQSNIMIDNPLDQAVTVTLFVKNQLGKSFQVWSGSVASLGQKTLTNIDIPLLATPLYQIYATAQCAVAPTTGTLTATFGGVQG